jgi:hypothetical protein
MYTRSNFRDSPHFSRSAALVFSVVRIMASNSTSAAVASAHGKYVKLLDMSLTAGTVGERDNAARLLARVFPDGAPETPYSVPTTLLVIQERGLQISF